MSSTDPIISFKDFSFKYKVQREPTLKNINLDIMPGEKVLILGPSGSGKSTLAKCINGIIPNQDKGEITGTAIINGKEVINTTIFKRGLDVGTVLQDSDAQFVGLSVGEDIAFYLENQNTDLATMKKSVAQNAKIVGIEDFLNRIPFNLSGGQKQRTSIAGILHGDTPILLFDEPLSALNPSNSRKVVELIDKLNRQEHKTVVMIEHRFEESLYKSIDKVVLINDGKIIRQGSPDEFLNDNILEQYGLQQPLYLDCIKKVVGNLSQNTNLWSLDLIDTKPYQTAFENFVNDNKINKSESKQSSSETIINIDHLQFGYDDDSFIDINNLKINRGEKISILGKNGSGKSTFAKLLTGILRPTNGDIIELGQSIQNQTIKSIGTNVAYVMQDPNKMIVEDTVENEVKLTLQLHDVNPDEAEEKVANALKVTDLYSMRDWPITALSYGQKKRLTIASLLVLNPKCLIMDEPTAGQDFYHYKKMMDFIDELVKKQNITLIIITHDMQMALKHTDRSLVISDGQIVADDNPFTILADKKLVASEGLSQTSVYRLADKLGIDGEQLAKLTLNL